MLHYTIMYNIILHFTLYTSHCTIIVHVAAHGGVGVAGLSQHGDREVAVGAALPRYHHRSMIASILQKHIGFYRGFTPRLIKVLKSFSF